MKLISSFMGDVTLEKNKYHAITFKSTDKLFQFRNLLFNYFKNKKDKENSFMQIVNESGHEVKSKDLYFINFDCNEINLISNKDTNKVVQSYLMFMLENNESLIDEYIKLNSNVEQFASNINLGNEDFNVEFSTSNKTILNIINSLEINIDYGGNEIKNYMLRHFLIKMLLRLNLAEKEVFLLLSYPEADVGFDDYIEVIDLIKSLEITTLVVSSQSKFLTAAEDRMFLVEEYGTIYNTKNLEKELVRFKLLTDSVQKETILLAAIHDFLEDYSLIGNELKDFLKSNKL